MSLPRNEDEQPTEQKSSQETFYPFTREFLKKQVQKKHQRQKAASISQERAEQEDTSMAEVEKSLPQGLDEISAAVCRLAKQSGANTEEAKKDERVLVMASAVLEMSRLLRSFSQTMNAEMVSLNEKASQNLNLQEQYAKSVDEVTHQAVGNIYHQVKEQEKEAINVLMQYVEANSDQMEKDITACTESVKSATKAAENASAKIAKSLERFRRVKTFRDLLYYSAPVLVAVDIILRVVALAAHIP